MNSLHPVLTAFPVSLLSIVCLSELLQVTGLVKNLGRVIQVNLFLAAVFIGLAFFSGYQASELADQSFKISDDVIRVHHGWGRLLLFMIIPCVTFNFLYPIAKYGKGLFRAFYLLLLAGCYGATIYTGFLGGDLVFRHGAGVKLEAVSTATEHL